MRAQLHPDICAKLSGWDSVAVERDAALVLRPLLEREMPRETAAAGPWTAANWTISFAQTDGFTAGLLPFHQQLRAASGANDRLSTFAARRYAAIAVPVAVQIGLEGAIEAGRADITQSSNIRLAVEGAKALSTTLQEWRMQAGARGIAPTRAETDAVLPLLALWQVAGPTCERFLASRNLSSEPIDALRTLAHFTIQRLPERSPGLWANVEPTTLVATDEYVFIGNWVGKGMFTLDPIKNPASVRGQWSHQLTAEPLFTSLRRTLDAIAERTPLLVDTLAGVLPADHLGVLSNLADTQSAYSTRQYFSTTSVLILSPNRATNASSPTAGPRQRTLERYFAEWKQQLARKGRPLTEAHLSSAARIARHFDAESWRELSTRTQAPDVPHDARLILCQANPRARHGIAHILLQLGPMFRVRRQALQITLGLDPEKAPPPDLRAQLERRTDLPDLFRALKELDLVERLSLLASEDDISFDPAGSAKYWRRFLAGQPNPYCQLTEPENLVRGLAPMAYYHQLRRLVGQVYEPNTGDLQQDDAKRELLTSEIWRDAGARLGTCQTSLSYEQAILGASLAATRRTDMPGFDVARAYALAFQAAMGSGHDPRLPDSTGPARVLRQRIMTGRVPMDEAFLSGGSAVVTQLLWDWKKCATAIDASASVDQRIRSLGSCVEASQEIAQKHAGKNSLAAALRDPAFWAKLLDQNPNFEHYVTLLATDRSLRPAEALSAAAGAGHGTHPFLNIDFARMLETFQSKTLAVQELDLKEKPPAVQDLGWSDAVVVHAIEAVAPMLDAFALGRMPALGVQMPPQGALIAAAGQRAMKPRSGEDFDSRYRALCQNYRKLYPQFRFSFDAEVTADVPLAVVPSFLRAEGRNHNSLVTQLTQTNGSLNPERLSMANHSLTAVFVPLSTGRLDSTTAAVAWAAALQRALDLVPLNRGTAERELHAGLKGLLVENRVWAADMHRNRANPNPEREANHHRRMGLKGSEVAKALRALGPLPGEVFCQLGVEIGAMVNSSVRKEAREAVNAGLGPEAEVQGRAAILSTILAGTINCITGAARYVDETRTPAASIAPPPEREAPTPPHHAPVLSLPGGGD